MAGLFLAGCFSTGLWWVFALCAAALCALGALTFKTIRRYFIVCGCSFAVACVYSAAYYHFVYDDIISFDGQTVSVDGYVDSFNYVGHGQGYLTVKCSLGGHTTTVSFLVSDDDYEYYDDVHITGKVVKIKDSYNFLSESYNFSEGVFLKGDGAASVELKGTNSNRLFKAIRNYSDKVFNTVLQYSGFEEKGFLGAMLCGDKSEMDISQKNMLYRSGIGHIFAVSGTHLVILTSVVGFVLSRLLGKRRAYSIVMFLITWAFVIFAGMSVSVIRSAIMMSIVYLGDFFMRRGDCANSLGIAAIIICLFNPYCVFSSGFLLSFTSAFAAGAVAPLVYRRLNIKAKPLFLFKGLVFSCVESIFIAPLCVIFFGGFSVLSPLTNTLLIPVCTAALVLCFIVALTGGTAVIAKPMLWAATKLVKAVIAVVKVISKPSLLFVTAPAAAAVVIITLTCAAVIILACVSKKPIISVCAAACGMLLCMLVSNICVLISYDRLNFYIFARKKDCAAIVVQSDTAYILDMSDGARFTGAQMRVIQHYGVRKTSAVLVNSEPYYTFGKYKDKLFPQPDVYISGTQVPVEMNDTYELKTSDSVKLDDIRFTRLENGFELEYNKISYKIYPDRFVINGKVYDTNGVSVRFDTDDNEVRRLDYELGFTDYTW